MGIDRRNLCLCVLVTLGAILVAWPFAEGGYIDDFSYIHMAKTLAETGRFAYNGWPTAMLGIQVWWGAVWIWLFGFSFTLVRLSVLPLALGAVALVYLLARRAMLTPSDSLFAALLTALSTLFLPLAPTFMTDIPGFFFLLACLYGYTRAADAAEDSPARSAHVAPWRALAWLAIGTLCGVLGGTIRQPVWFAPIACTAVLCMRRCGGLSRSDRRVFRLASLLCGVIGVAALVAGTRWFSQQPYAIPTKLPSLDAVAQFRVASIAREAVTVATECALKVLPAMLFCLPWVVEHLSTGVRTRWGRITAMVTAIAMMAVLAGTLSRSFEGPLGLLAGSWRPTGHAFHDAGVGLIRCGVLGLAVAVAVAATVALGRARGIPVSASRLPAAVILPLAFLVPYGGSLLLVSQTTDGIFPRYYLPFLPALTCGLLFCTRSLPASPHAAADRRSVLGWLLVGFFALRGIAILHDEFADTRTRLEAIALLQRQGVPRERITSKWVIDGWEQIERAGSINDPRIRVPADAYRTDVPYDYPDPKFRNHFPALRPDFMVVDEREITPGDSGDFPRFSFTAWWRPPYYRTIVIRHQHLPERLLGDAAGRASLPSGDTLELPSIP
jgi:4-amino-4-deoxy-L-arabinose transferase-like glycosyltransferase